MKHYDAAVIGGGILGCFAARNLRRYNISTLLVEKEEDVCRGVTRANSAIVYAGYDNRVGSLKAQMTLKANRSFSALCDELEIAFSRCGSLMVSFTPEGDTAIRKKLKAGEENAVPGLKLLSGKEALDMEPMLSPDVSLALFAPSTGTVNPWRLGIAAWENATAMGCDTMLNTSLLGIEKSTEGYILKTNREEISCRALINCAGLSADRVQELLFEPTVRIFCDGADFIVLDKHAKKPGRIIFHQDAEHGKGITAIPTTEGNLLLGPSRRPVTGSLWASSKEGLDFLRRDAERILPGVETDMCIRSFAGPRPNPHRVVLRDGEYVPDGSSIGSFVIERPEPGFISFIGIKTPGITCAQELGMYAARAVAEYLNAEERRDFDGGRKAIVRRDERDIVCRCESVTRGQILEAIKRGAGSVEAVKRRVGSGMGPCQGSRCTIEIERMLEDYRDGKL